MSDLKGKCALVTGSTSGIGLGVATHLARQGVNLVLNGFGDPAVIDSLCQSLSKDHGVEVIHSPADMSKPDQIQSMMQLAQSRFGGVDILVNNAGIQYVSLVEDFPCEKWDAILAINLTSSFHTIQNCVPYMKSKKWGRIINIASAHALVASPGKSAYVAAKHGLLGLTKTVALELAEHSITANCVCPGYVLTPLVEKQIPETAKVRGMTEEQVVKEVLLAAQPTKRFVTTDEVAGTVVFLCSSSAASITGTSIAVEGGWTAH